MNADDNASPGKIDISTLSYPVQRRHAELRTKVEADSKAVVKQPESSQMVSILATASQVGLLVQRSLHGAKMTGLYGMA